MLAEILMNIDWTPITNTIIEFAKIILTIDFSGVLIICLLNKLKKS